MHGRNAVQLSRFVCTILQKTAGGRGYLTIPTQRERKAEADRSRLAWFLAREPVTSNADGLRAAPVALTPVFARAADVAPDALPAALAAVAAGQPHAVSPVASAVVPDVVPDALPAALAAVAAG